MHIKSYALTLLTTSVLLAFLMSSSAIAAPNCEDPKHQTKPACQDGGDGGGNDTAAIPQNCQLDDSAGNSILSDGLQIYLDGEDKVRCSTGSTADNKDTSNLNLATVARGKVSSAIRKIDLVIDENTCTDAVACASVPDGVFERAASIDDMENVRLRVQAYAGTDGLAVPHIQSLTPDSFFEVSMSFALQGAVERWSFQMLGRELPDDFKQGMKCDLETPADARSDDVTLYVWPDQNNDGKPDGYTVTTAGENDVDTSNLPPAITTPGSRQATLCSNVSINGDTCPGPGGSDLCHLIAKMQVQFTWHSENQ